jgi:hypothetical protein
MSPVSWTKKDLENWKKLVPKIRFPAQVIRLGQEIGFQNPFSATESIRMCF